MVIEKLIVNFMLSLYNTRESSLKVTSILLSRTIGHQHSRLVRWSYKPVSLGPNPRCPTFLSNLKTLKIFDIIFMEDEGRAKALKKNPLISKYDTKYAPLTQLVEYSTLNAGVQGSSPWWRTICRVSSVGRAPALQAGCRRFEPVTWYQAIVAVTAGMRRRQGFGDVQQVELQKSNLHGEG